MWVPDQKAFIKMLTHEAPDFLGGWCLVGIIAASMSTADGAILAMGTVMSHNVIRQFDAWVPSLAAPENLLKMARITTIPFTVTSACIASFYHSSRPSGAMGYLLIVAFDVVLATVGTCRKISTHTLPAMDAKMAYLIRAVLLLIYFSDSIVWMFLR
jgi:Na+/proline symporter